MGGKTTLKMKSFLDEILTEFHRKEWLHTDPLGLVVEWATPEDQEVVAILSAVLAYGNVKQIRKSIQGVLNVIGRLDETPASIIRKLGNLTNDAPHSQSLVPERLEVGLKEYKHRFNRGVDVFLLLTLIGKSTREYGSVGAHFLSPHLGNASLPLERRWNLFIQEWKKGVKELPQDQRTFGYFLTAPEDGSSCKRWCMLLRWMIRKDQVDLGLWRKESGLLAQNSIEVRESELFMPLDTHTGRISQYLGITTKKSLNWRTTLEVTEFFRSVDPDDPVKYDFALSRLGILDLCQKRFKTEICGECKLLSVCHFAAGELKKEERKRRTRALPKKP
jgi:uncharacterized protein (TIGR02757 family)